MLLHAHCIGTVSRYIAGTIRTAVPELAADRVRVWRNSVNRERFRSEDVKRKALQKRRILGISADEKIILFAGRLSPEKGAHILLEAMKEVADTGLRVRLVMAGAYLSGEKRVTSAYEEKLHYMAKELGDRVIFTGYIPYEDVPVLYRMADVAVIPSLVADAAPLSVIESVTGGVPVIATAVGGIPEYTAPSCAVLLSPPKEAGGGGLSVRLAGAIRELLTDEERRKQMAKAALALSDGWTVHAYYERFLACVGAGHV